MSVGQGRVAFFPLSHFSFDTGPRLDVRRMGNRVRILGGLSGSCMFADGTVFLARSARELPAMLDVATDIGHRWSPKK